MGVKVFTMDKLNEVGFSTGDGQIHRDNNNKKLYTELYQGSKKKAVHLTKELQELYQYTGTPFNIEPNMCLLEIDGENGTFYMLGVNKAANRPKSQGADRSSRAGNASPSNASTNRRPRKW